MEQLYHHRNQHHVSMFTIVIDEENMSVLKIQLNRNNSDDTRLPTFPSNTDNTRIPIMGNGNHFNKSTSGNDIVGDDSSVSTTPNCQGNTISIKLQDEKVVVLSGGDQLIIEPIV